VDQDDHGVRPATFRHAEVADLVGEQPVPLSRRRQRRSGEQRVRSPPETVDAAASNAHDAGVFVSAIDRRTQIDASDRSVEPAAGRPVVVDAEDTVASAHVVERPDDQR
jgi:hypothetical protein